MKSLIILALLQLGIQAQAQGFVCRANKEDLALAVFSASDASATRKVDVMVLADPRIGFDRQNLARFTSDSGNLSSQGLRHVATVKAETLDTAQRKGLIAGVRLDQIKKFELETDFSQARPALEGDEIETELLITKITGEEFSLEVECLRYAREND